MNLFSISIQRWLKQGVSAGTANQDEFVDRRCLPHRIVSGAPYQACDDGSVECCPTVASAVTVRQLSLFAPLSLFEK
jgi:hypothetical protein